MKAVGLFLALVCLAPAADYRAALPGYRYAFPRDHFAHPDFQTEWWYYTGNISTEDGHRFGFELTFFRQAVARGGGKSVWRVEDVYLAHLALSDLTGRRFYHTRRVNRGGPGLAGADGSAGRIWNGNWEARWQGERQELRAVSEEFSFELALDPRKPLVIHGIGGVSQKADGAGRASHYISFPRLAVAGTVRLGGREYKVSGLGWMDHEFFTHQLSANQSGWDWFSLQLDDGTELMLFRLRRKDGSADPYSAGTFVDRAGRGRHLAASAFRLTPLGWWQSRETGGKYPVRWRVEIPGLGVDLEVSTPLAEQELASQSPASPTYWEGAVEVRKTGTGRLSGAGYLEMTGYAGGLGALTP